MRKKRILFISDSILAKSGYGRVARSILEQIADNPNYEIAQLGFSDMPMKIDLPIDYYTQIKDHKECCKRNLVIEHIKKGNPERTYLGLQDGSKELFDLPKSKPCLKGKCVPQDHYGYDSVYFVIQHFKPDIVVPINDIWGLYNIVHLKNRANFKFLPYLAIDSDCMFPILNPPEGRPGLPPIDTVGVLSGADKVIVFTDWARNVINKTANIVTQGKELSNISIIPHGVNTSIWKPLSPEDRIAARKKYFNIEDDTILVGSIARNQPRKRLDGAIKAIRTYVDRYEKPNRKVKIYFHCSLQDNMGWDLQWLSAWYGVQDRCIFDKNLKPGIGPEDWQLNEIANCFDAHLMLTNSEGWCNLPDTNIMIPEGSKRIDSFNIGDKVITHKGNIKPVSNILTREYSGEMIRIETVGNMEGLVLTPNHRVLRLKQERDILNEEWIESEKLNVGDFVSLPSYKGTDDYTVEFNISDYLDMSTKTVLDGKIYPLVKNQTGLTNKPNTKYNGIKENFELDSEMCRFIGYYLAEGCSKDRRIRLSINASGDERIRTLTSKLFSNTKTEIYDRNREVLVICDTILSEWFESFGSNAHEKHIPEKLFETIYKYNKLSKEMLNGLIEGDGSFIKKNSSLNFTTVSKRLAEQTRLLFLRNGIYAKIYRAKRGEYTVLVQGKQCIETCRSFIDKCGRWDLQKNICRHKQAFNKLWFKITDIAIEEYTGTVYNLSVEDDESYIAEGVAVHNCLPALETAAAGIPNVITKYSAHADWGKDTHLFCKVAGWYHEPRTGFVKAIADTDDAAKQIHLVTSSKQMWNNYSKKGIKLGEKLEWKNVCKQWVELFDSIDISDLREDRYNLTQNGLPVQELQLKYFPDRGEKNDENS